MKLFRSQAGLTITELMVVIAISGLLMAAAATGFSAFFSKFNEMNSVMELQRDAFNCMQTIKSGIPIGRGASLKFQGVATSDSIVFLGANTSSSSNIILYPPVSDYLHQNDFVRIFWDGKFVRATYLHGTIQPPAPLYLFPKPSRNNVTEVTRLMFTQANTGESEAKVVLVELDARVRLRRNVYRTVSYSTRMALTLK